MRSWTRGKWKCGGVCGKLFESSVARNVTKCGKSVCEACFPRHAACSKGNCLAGSPVVSRGQEHAQGD